MTNHIAKLPGEVLLTYRVGQKAAQKLIKILLLEDSLVNLQ